MQTISLDYIFSTIEEIHNSFEKISSLNKGGSSDTQEKIKEETRKLQNYLIDLTKQGTSIEFKLIQNYGHVHRKDFKRFVESILMLFNNQYKTYEPNQVDIEEEDEEDEVEEEDEEDEVEEITDKKDFGDRYLGKDILPNDSSTFNLLLKVNLYKDYAEKHILNENHLKSFYSLILKSLIGFVDSTLNSLNPKEWPNNDKLLNSEFFRKFAVKDSLDTLFISEDVRDKAYDILVKFKIIDANHNLILKTDTLIGAFNIWFNALKNADPSLIKESRPVKDAKFLNEKFKGLKFSYSFFSKPYAKAEKIYGKEIEREVNKLAQLSQK